MRYVEIEQESYATFRRRLEEGKLAQHRSRMDAQKRAAAKVAYEEEHAGPRKSALKSAALTARRAAAEGGAFEFGPHLTLADLARHAALRDAWHAAKAAYEACPWNE